MKLTYQGQTFDIDLEPFIRKVGSDMLADAGKNPMRRLMLKSAARGFEEEFVKKCASYLVDTRANPQAWKQFRPRKDHDILEELMHLIETVATGLVSFLVLEMVEDTRHESEENLSTNGASTRLALARALLTNGTTYTRQLYPEPTNADTSAPGATIGHTAGPDTPLAVASIEVGSELLPARPVGAARHDANGKNHGDAGVDSQTP